MLAALPVACKIAIPRTMADDSAAAEPTLKKKKIGLVSVGDVTFGYASTKRGKSALRIPQPRSTTFEAPTLKNMELVCERAVILG